MSDEFNNENNENENLNSTEDSANTEHSNNSEQSQTSENSQYRMSFSREDNKLSDDISNTSKRHEEEAENADTNENQYNQYMNQNNYYQNPDNNSYDNNGNDDGNNKKKRNMGPVWGIIAAALVLVLIIGGLLAAVKLTGNGKDSLSNETESPTKIALSKETSASDETKNNAEKSTDVADNTSKNDETNETNTPEKSTEAEVTPTSISGAKGEKVETTGTVSATLLDVSPIVEEVMPTVVAVTNTTYYKSSSSGLWGWYSQGSSKDYTNSGAGSGVIIAQSDEQIMIATNAHVVLPEDYSNYGLTAENSEYEITFCDDSTAKATLKGYDEDMDLAVLIVNKSDMTSDTINSIKIATIGDSSDLKVGNGAIVIGNAMGFGQSVTVGYISALNREYTIDGTKKTLIQTDAAINPGNSGGGLFDMNGHLIGINEAKISSTSIEGICFAIPISAAESIFEDIINSETVTREKVTDEAKQCYLGIGAQQQYSEAYDGQGAFVGSVIENGPAANAGIMEYDIITKVDGKEVTSWATLQEELSYHEGGETVAVEYYTLEENGRRREYVKKETQVTLGFKKDYTNTDQ